MVTGTAYTPKETIAYENKIFAVFQQKYPGTVFLGPTELRLKFFLPMPKKAKKAERASMMDYSLRPTVKYDCDNLAKTVLDGLFSEDGCVVKLVVEKYYAEDDKVGVYVEIEDQLHETQLADVDFNLDELIACG